jgi:hypothetical protein
MPPLMRFFQRGRKTAKNKSETDKEIQQIKKSVTQKQAISNLQKSFRNKKILANMQKTYKSVETIPLLVGEKLNQVSIEKYNRQFHKPEVISMITGHLYKSHAIQAILIERLRNAPSFDDALIMFQTDDTQRLLSMLSEDERRRIRSNYMSILQSAAYQLHRRKIKLKYARIWAAMSQDHRAAAKKKAKLRFNSALTNWRAVEAREREDDARWLLDVAKVGITDKKAHDEVSRQEQLLASDMENAELLPQLVANKWKTEEARYEYTDEPDYDEDIDEEGYYYNNDWHDNYIDWGSLINYKSSNNDPRFTNLHSPDFSPVSPQKEWSGNLYVRALQFSYYKFVNIRVKVNDINNADIFNNNLSVFSKEYHVSRDKIRPQPIEIHSATILYIKLEFSGGYSLNHAYFQVDTKRIQFKKDYGFYNVGGPEQEETESGFYKYNLSNMPGNISELIYVISINDKK